MSTAKLPPRRVQPAALETGGLARPWFLPQEQFVRLLALERKRSERSRQCFVLMLLESSTLMNGEGDLEAVLDSLGKCTRETDIQGWYKACSVIGVVFTEIGCTSGRDAVNVLSEKVFRTLGRVLRPDWLKEVRITFHLYPEEWEGGGHGGPIDPALYPDLLYGPDQRRGARLVKRSMDIIGSLGALLLLSPVLAVIALLIKLTSEGPVLFKQKRIGQYGRRFTFLKFRSMYADSGHGIHEEYVKALIAGDACAQQAAGSEHTSSYKLTNDPRITPLGRFLRRSSLDELPQFYNVLKGEMSLVGPRPPIPYEYQAYEQWHRRRLLAVKPGITGLWQVEGRSRVKFNDMVRLDLSYASTWSPWLDVKILLRTPGAVVSGAGAH